jgi:hypothetical protein
MQRKELAFFSGFIVQKRNGDDFFLLAGVKPERCCCGGIINVGFGRTVSCGVGKLGDLAGRFIQADFKIHLFGILLLGGTGHFGGVI